MIAEYETMLSDKELLKAKVQELSTGRTRLI